MRVLYLITKSERGGAQSVLLELLHAHKEKGDEVLLVCGSYGFLVEEAKKLGFEVRAVRTLGNTFNPIMIWHTFSRLRKIARNFSPDIVSCHSSFAGFIGRLALGKKYKTIFTAHGIAFTSGAPLWRKPIAIVAEFVASFFCEKIIAVSKNDERTLRKFLFIRGKKVVTIHNGVSIPANIAFPKINSDTIVFVGRLVAPKDPKILIHALDILKRGGDFVPKLLLIGNGPQRLHLESLITFFKLQDRIQVLGECDQSTIKEILRDSSLFVLPTKWEGFPMTILEAMAGGMAIIASDVGGIGEAVTEDIGVLLPRCANAEIWARNIKKILSDKQKLEQRGRNSYRSAMENFSKEMMISKTFEVYKEIISS